MEGDENNCRIRSLTLGKTFRKNGTLGNMVPKYPISTPHLPNVPEWNPHVAMNHILDGNKSLPR